MESSSITVRTTLQAPIEKVWDYWTTPQHIMNWNNASDDWHTPRAENDLRVGGKFLSHMAAKDGSMGFDFGGTYTAITPLSRIEYVLGDNRKVTTEFSANDQFTDVIETFDPEKINPLELQRTGWQAILDNFKRYTETH
jgi:uncharacterized protein YndB with AHSA1/START domain